MLRVLGIGRWQSAELLRAMEEESHVDVRALKVDGGMTKSALLMQLQADFLGKEVHLAKEAESTALGAAYAAGLAVKYWERWVLRQLCCVLQTHKVSFALCHYPPCLAACLV